MYRKGEVGYQALPLPDRLELDEAGSLAAFTQSVGMVMAATYCEGSHRRIHSPAFSGGMASNTGFHEISLMNPHP